MRMKGMEDWLNDSKLELTELKIANQSLTEENRGLKIQNEKLKTEGALERADELDKQIEDLIAQVKKLKGDYMAQMANTKDLEAEIQAKELALKQLKTGYEGIESILKTTQEMLEVTKRQYGEQLDFNTKMRQALNEMYSLVVSTDNKDSPIGKEETGLALTTQLQLALVQLINKVLNPADKANNN